MTGYTVLACPSCGAKASLQAGTVSATCQFCGSQLILNPDQAAVLQSAGAREAPLIPIPTDITTRQTGSGLLLTRRWYSPKYIFMAVFALFWDAFLVFWFGMVFTTNAPIFIALFPLIHLAVGIYLTYSTLAGFVNSSTILVNREKLSVTHGPLPWPGEAHLGAEEIGQLYVREVIRHSRRSTSTSYTLAAVLKNGRSVDLLKGLDRSETGVAVERQIEQYLNLSDRPVAGELDK